MSHHVFPVGNSAQGAPLVDNYSGLRLNPLYKGMSDTLCSFCLQNESCLLRESYGVDEEHMGPWELGWGNLGGFQSEYLAFLKLTGSPFPVEAASSFHPLIPCWYSLLAEPAGSQMTGKARKCNPLGSACL